MVTVGKVAPPKHQKNQRGRMASISRLVLFGKDWLWLSSGYEMLLPTITIRLGKRGHRCDCRYDSHSGWRPEGPNGRPCAVAHGAHAILFSRCVAPTRYRTGSKLLTPTERMRLASAGNCRQRIITGNESPKHGRHS